jgi:hypothetical protein
MQLVLALESAHGLAAAHTTLLLVTSASWGETPATIPAAAISLQDDAVAGYLGMTDLWE